MARRNRPPVNYVIETADQLEGRNLGPLPLMMPILRRMKIEETIRAHCPGDVRQLLSHDQVFLSLVCNRLCSPMPLLHVGAWAKHTGSELLLGVDADWLTDDRLADTLDAIFAHRWNILAEIALHVSQEFEVSLKRVHYDPMSFHFTGEYDDQSASPSLLPELIPMRIEHGRHSHGRDIKEAQVGVNLANDGKGPLPFFYHTLDGGTNHHTAIANNLDHLLKYVKPAETLFITDRGCFSANTAVRIKKKERCDFISTVTWTETYAQIFDRAKLNMCEASFLSIQEKQKRETGKSKETWETHLLGEVPHTFTNDGGEAIRARLIFVKSSAHQKVQAKTREKSIHKIRTDLERLHKSVAGGYYDDEKKINASVLKAFGKRGAHKYFDYSITKLSDAEIAAQPKPGRGKRRAKYHFTFTFDEQAAKHDAKHDGLYVIATSLAKNKYSTDEVFTMFKEQHHIETAHHQWKAPIRLRPIFLHKPHRIESLILVQFIALMAFYLLQREYRLRSSNPKCRTTAETLIRQFSFVPISLREQASQVYVSIFKPNEKQHAILQVLGHPDLGTQLRTATAPSDARG